MAQAREAALGPEQQDLESVSAALHRHIDAFAAEHDVAFGELAAMLMSIGLWYRAIHYVTSVEKPSADGLKLDFERFRRDLGLVFRDMKRGAEGLVTEVREAIAEHQGEAASK